MQKKYWILGGVIVLLLVIGYGFAPSRSRVELSSPYGVGGNTILHEEAAYDAAYGDAVAQRASTGVSKIAVASNAPAPSQPPGYQTGGGEKFVPENRLIIKTATMSIVVEDVRQAVQSVVDYAHSKNGFEVTRNISKEGVGFVGTVTVRIPVAAFDDGMNAARALGEVRSQAVHGLDVTEEFVDVQAQLSNLAATEAQFLDIMRRATKIEDVLAVQRELNTVRAQIERLEGRKKYLQLSADLSTLTVHFSTNPESLPVVNEQDTWKPLGVAKDAARNLIELAKVVANTIIWMIVYIPIWLILSVLAYLVYRRVQKQRT